MKIKLHQSKERNTIAKQSQFSSLNSSMIKIKKQDTKHTKVSTAVTSQSLHLNTTTKKSIKQKNTEPQIQQKKQKTIRNTEMVTSGRTKTLKQKIKNKKSCDFQIQRKFNDSLQDGSVSFREYCLVENSFVPIVSKNQSQKLQEMMRSTADTTKRFDDFNRATFRNVFPFKLRDHNESVSKISQTEQNIFNAKRKSIDVANISIKKVSKREVQINASPFYEEVGIQYSERPQPIVQKILFEKKEEQEKPKEVKKAVQIDIQTDDFMVEQEPQQKSTFQSHESPVKFLDNMMIESQLQEPQVSHQQSLSDLLLKLQFKHLPNEGAFSTLSKPQKQHYSQLLNSLIAKLNCSPRQKQAHPTSMKTKQMIEIEEVHLVPLEEIKLKYEKLQMEILKRESYQMNWVNRRFQGGVKEGSVDTSLMVVNSFLLNFFCFLQLNYMNDFLENIKKQYGPSYYSEFLRVTRGLKASTSHGNVLDEDIFEEFCQELNEISAYEKHHFRAVFDFINNLLDTYRPSFHHKGEPFPWALKMHNSICQYVIDQDSMEIIFIEVKENIEQAVSMLCGLIVDESLYKDISEINPLALKRNQKENVLIDSWLKEDGDDNHVIECEATKVFNELSEEVYNMLLLEVLGELPFKTQKSK